MASVDVLSFSELLEPISEEQPAGLPIRETPGGQELFYQVRQARAAAREAEDAVRDYALMSEEDREYVPTPKKPDWKGLVDLASKVIAENSKDLWIAAWLTEGLTRKDGFAGVRDGFRLVRELCEKFWDGIHPRPDEQDGLRGTLSQLSVLNEILVFPIEQIPITPETTSLPPFTSTDYKDAAMLATSPARAERLGEGAVSLEMFQRSVTPEHLEFYANLLEDIDAAGRQVEEMEKLLSAKCEEDEQGESAAPSTSRLSDTIAECRDRVKSLTKDLLPSQPAEAAEVASPSGDIVIAGGEAPAPTTAVRTREDAFQHLQRVADFFRETEPHSPVSYALEQAVRWGRMSLPKLLDELISDDSVRKEIARRTGIPDSDANEQN